MSAGNIREIAEAGADMFVAGSAIFSSEPSPAAIAPLPPPAATLAATPVRPARTCLLPPTRPPVPVAPRELAGYGVLGGSPLSPCLLAADDYKATIDGMREELAKVPFPGNKAKVAA